MIDLHSHTTASDGSLSPKALVERAARQGVSALAITDHDTLDGLAEGIAAGKEYGVEIVPGLEISAEFAIGTMHILGYYVTMDEQAPLAQRLAYLRQLRDERNPKMITRLQEMGFDITMEEVAKAAGGKVIGRPHFALVMMEKGYVSSTKEAFDKYLAKGSAAYVEKVRLAPQEAIKLIKQAGGVAVLAHPYQLKAESDEQLTEIIGSLKEAGLDGMEVIYSRHSPAQLEKYQHFARKFELLITGGSDFHGISKPDIEVGIGLGNLAVPPQLLDNIKQRAIQNSRNLG